MIHGLDLSRIGHYYSLSLRLCSVLTGSSKNQNEFLESISLHTSKLFLLNNNLLSDVDDQSRGGTEKQSLEINQQLLHKEKPPTEKTNCRKHFSRLSIQEEEETTEMEANDMTTMPSPPASLWRSPWPTTTPSIPQWKMVPP
ncbi:hypothetical protein NPIL_487461 [Nephila pilipes]|uniref:Uncharacterized protein n=1 Tax=Nephila pilipes TaxID=299642 RepID=A0A8X6NXR6_NEPPI|nr:hypothetical protein NPIL_487461 [Nephila pilipes]